MGTAVVVLPLVLLGMLWASPGVGFAIVSAAVALAAWELDALMRAREVQTFRLTGVFLLELTYLAAAFSGAPPGHESTWGGSAPLWPPVVLVMLTALLVRRGGDFARDVPAAALTLLGAVYLGGLGGTMAALRIMAPRDAGPWRIALLLAIVMAGDTAAYFTGRALGRHKLAPAVSPGKTVEGAVGGLAGGVLGSWAVSAAGLHLPLPHVVVLGVLVTVFGTVGDLVESLLKRWAGVKDSGRLFPGHGGMLDRLDSLLFGAAVLYYYFGFFG
jgi:phosphatidate cytidylyltransferase